MSHIRDSHDNGPPKDTSMSHIRGTWPHTCQSV